MAHSQHATKLAMLVLHCHLLEFPLWISCAKQCLPLMNPGVFHCSCSLAGEPASVFVMFGLCGHMGNHALLSLHFPQRACCEKDGWGTMEKQV